MDIAESTTAAVAPGIQEEDEGFHAADLRRSFLAEWDFLSGLIEQIVQSRGSVERAIFKKAQTIVEKYQEQGNLLEPYLAIIIEPMMDILREKVAEKDRLEEVDMEIIKKVCTFTHTFTMVCGHKTVVKFFPHQASDLEMVVALMEKCHKEFRSGDEMEESACEWQTKCTLLLWLSILVLIPFDIASVDTALIGVNDSPSEILPISTLPLVERMLSICKHYLGNPGPMREMSGVLLSRLLTRPDMNSALGSFIAWSRDVFGSTQDSPVTFFIVPGVVFALASIFKVGGRDMLLEIAPTLWKDSVRLSSSSVTTCSPLLRKLLVKLMQRIGLVVLPPRTASWRYMESSPSLTQHLNLPNSSKSTYEGACLLAPAQRSLYKPINAPSCIDGEDDVEVSDLVEEIMQQLLAGLTDKDTVVRWSAAKGVGRVTSRLTSENADDVVASVLELFSPNQGDGAWHGGCLALAELARRGLLLPKRLAEVAPFIVKALHYDIRRGPHSVGAHVRDAAAYVCWAFARAYSPPLMRESFRQLAPALITVACYDREVNCRRAASAAFQENVGRQGDVHGIDIVNIADYFTIGSRYRAYTSVAVDIAQYSEYRMPLIEELLQSKISHWDRGLRELASEALALLVKYDPTYFEEHILCKLIGWSLSTDLNLRHGATLSAAELIYGLHRSGYVFAPERQKALANMVPAIEKARLYRGKGGEIMRSAVSRLIECIAIAKIPLPSKVSKALHLSIDENLKHPNSQIQVAAAAAFHVFVLEYLLPANTVRIGETTSKHLQILRKDPNQAKRRGSALAIGGLPQEYLVPLWKEVIDTLCMACLEENVQERDAESRVNAVRSLTKVCTTLCGNGAPFLSTEPADIILLVKMLRVQVMNTLFTALNDYAIDNRGDVGSWIREAAMESVYSCLRLLSETVSSLLACGHGDYRTEVLDGSLSARVIGELSKQGVEKIDRIRETAGRVLQKVLYARSLSVLHVPHRKELEKLIPDDDTLSWADPSVSFPRLMELIKFSEYRPYVSSGLVISVGGLSDVLGRVSLQCLLNFLEATHGTDKTDTNDQNLKNAVFDYRKFLACDLLSILNTSAGNDRVIIPTIKTFDILLGKGLFHVEFEEELAEVLEALKRELKGCKDIAKILLIMNALCGISSMGLQNRKEALRQLILLLGNRYPKVRRIASEQLYLVAMELGAEIIDSVALNTVLDLITETCWDGPLDATVERRKQLLTLLNLQRVEAEQNSPVQVVSQVKRFNDENELYASLVDAAGY